MSARQRGFSLLEVLVAFVILALVGVALFQLFGGALNNGSAAAEWSRALLVAESRLAAAASTVPLKEATDQGTEDDGRLRWETRVSQYQTPETPPELERLSETMTIRMYRVDAQVTFPGDNGRDRVVALSTLKIGPRNPP